jgi:hypothetical protein
LGDIGWWWWLGYVTMMCGLWLRGGSRFCVGGFGGDEV